MIREPQCWRRRRIDPAAGISLTQSDPLRIIVCAGFVQVWRWVSLASARGSIRPRRQQYLVVAAVRASSFAVSTFLDTSL